MDTRQKKITITVIDNKIYVIVFFEFLKHDFIPLNFWESVYTLLYSVACFYFLFYCRAVCVAYCLSACLAVSLSAWLPSSIQLALCHGNFVWLWWCFFSPALFLRLLLFLLRRIGCLICNERWQKNKIFFCFFLIYFFFFFCGLSCLSLGDFLMRAKVKNVYAAVVVVVAAVSVVAVWSTWDVLLLLLLLVFSFFFYDYLKDFELILP